MARYPYHGTTKDQNGGVIQAATVSVFEAGGSTAASVYAASSGGSAVNSVTSDSTTGAFVFWVDRSDYEYNQRFKVIISKDGFTPVPYDDQVVFYDKLMIDIEDFDPVGDGIADDTLAIQAAVDALPSNGGTILFQAKSYLITTNITYGVSVKFLGIAGSMTSVANKGTIIKTDSDTTMFFQRNSSGVIFENIRFYGAGSGKTSNHGIEIESTGTNRSGLCTLYNVSFENMGGNAIELTQVDFIHGYNVKFKNNYGWCLNINASGDGEPSTGICFWGFYASIGVGNSGIINIGHGSNCSFYGLDLNGGSGPAIKLVNADSISFFGLHAEFNDPCVLIAPGATDTVENISFYGNSLWLAENVHYVDIEGTAGGTVDNIVFRNINFKWKTTEPTSYIKVNITCSPTNIKFLNCSNLTYGVLLLYTGVDVQLSDEAFQTFVDEDATPNIRGYTNFATANTQATTITDFDGDVSGRTIRVVFGDANTTVSFTGAHIKGNAGGDWSPASGDHMTCVCKGTVWYCAISDNTA